MGLGGAVTGLMGATGNYPKVNVPGGSQQNAYGTNLASYLGGVPTTYAAQAQYDPLFAQLGSQNLQDFLLGTPAGSQTISATAAPGQWYNPSTGQVSNLRPADMSGWSRATRGTLFNRQVPTAGSQGAVSLLEQYLGPALNRMQSASRASTSADLGNIGPGANAAYRASNPELSSLMSNLSGTAQQGLDLGAALDPSLKAVTEQSIRQGQAARGLGRGPADVLEESRALTSLGQSLRQQRQQFAQGVAGLEQNYQDPFLSLVFGAPSSAAGAQSLLGLGSGVSSGVPGQVISPAANYDIFNTGYNARAGANIANANTGTAMLQGFNSMD